jgi:hypothetical protein
MPVSNGLQYASGSPPTFGVGGSDINSHCRSSDRGDFSTLVIAPMC